MIYKSSDKITDVDPKKRIVKGYFSIFGNEDADKDIIEPGAYEKTIRENMRIKHLYQHDPRMPLSGVKKGTLKVWEDTTGLAFESQISDTSIGRDVVKLYEDGVVDEHSVGIQVMKSKKRGGIRYISEVKLWEGSTVTWGANSSALMTEIKMTSMLKALKKGNYENEEIFDLLEIYIAQQEALKPELKEEHRVNIFSVINNFTAAINV